MIWIGDLKHLRIYFKEQYSSSGNVPPCITEKTLLGTDLLSKLTFGDWFIVKANFWNPTFKKEHKPYLKEIYLILKMYVADSLF